MIKKYLLIPIIIFITICGGEDADVSENNETVQNTINSSSLTSCSLSARSMQFHKLLKFTSGRPQRNFNGTATHFDLENDENQAV